MIAVDNSNLLYTKFEKTLQFLLANYNSFVDFGCGDGQHTRNLKCEYKIYLDCVKAGNRPRPFAEMDASNFQWETKPDVVIGLDFLEHLTKEEGYRFIIKALTNSKLVILFCPEGDYHIQPDMPDNPDAHQCGWTAQEMSDLGFQVILMPNYHDSLGIGAFLCWWHIDNSRFYSPELLLNHMKNTVQ